MSSWVPDDNTIIKNTSSIISEDNNAVLSYNKKVDIKMPKKELEDYQIAVSSNALKKVYDECSNIDDNIFSYAEFFLAMSTLFLGGFFSAIISKLPYEKGWLNIIFYSLCPCLGLGCLIGWYFCRKISVKDASNLKKIIEDNIPNPADNEEIEE